VSTQSCETYSAGTVARPDLHSFPTRRSSDLVRRGMTAEQALHQARRSFGGFEQVKEAYRDRRGLPVLETALRDLRYGVRMLRRRSEEHTSELQSPYELVCRLLLEKTKNRTSR